MVACVRERRNGAMTHDALISGEFRRLLDERFRLTVPGELAGNFARTDEPLMLVKELPGMTVPDASPQSSQP